MCTLQGPSLEVPVKHPHESDWELALRRLNEARNMDEYASAVAFIDRLRERDDQMSHLSGQLQMFERRVLGRDA